MTSKRARARAALLEWEANTTPEMFVEEHKGIVFAGSDKSPKVEIIHHDELFLANIRDDFESLFQRELFNKFTRNNDYISNICAYNQVLVVSHTDETITSDMVDVPLDVSSLGSSKTIPDEFNLKNYDDLISSKKLIKTPMRCC